ncbi:MAG: sister chromatid cohesion protein PDS5 [Candidatus Omnitrophota bacterium]
MAILIYIFYIYIMVDVIVKKIIVSFMLLAFLLTGGVVPVSAQTLLSRPGEMVALSTAFHPPVLSGVKVYADNPFRFDFILDRGDATKGQNLALKDESTRLIKYFLASLTVPEKDLWVNLSPYEKDRIVPKAFGQTEMGRDLLAQDYFLKQLTSSLMFPEGDLGKKFWAEVYKQAQEKFGTTDIPVDTFNKVWIVPSKAVIYENKDAAYVVESKLKVMLDSDYVAAANASTTPIPGVDVAPSVLAKEIIRQIILPALEKEVNEGKNFAQLRQVYNSLILATWYKRKMKESLLSKAYVDQQKVGGVNIDDPKEAEKIWVQYVEAFKKGAYNFIKEEKDPASGDVVPKKYFSGGVAFDKAMNVILEYTKQLPGLLDNAMQVTVDMTMPGNLQVNGDDIKGARINTGVSVKFLLDKEQYPLWKINSMGYILLGSLDDEDSSVRMSALKQIMLLVDKKPELINQAIIDKLLVLMGDNEWNVRQAAANAIGELAKARPELMNEGVRDALVGKLSDDDNDVRQAAANAIGELAKARPELMNEGVRDALVGKFSDGQWNVRQAAANAIGELAKARPELMNEGFRDALVGKLSDDDNDVRQAAVQVVGALVIAQEGDLVLTQEMVNFVQDQTHGFGLEQNYITKGMNLLFAFARVNDPEALNVFLSVIRPLNQQQKSALADIAYSYFKGNAFTGFMDILRLHRAEDYNSLIDVYRSDFLKMINLDREIQGRILDGWDGVARLLSMAQRYPIIQETIVSKVIVTLRLLRQGAGRDTGFRQAANIEGRFPELKDNLMRLLENGNIPLYVKRRLLQSFPLGDREDIELLRERAIRLVNAATGLGDSRTGLVGRIRDRIHNNPSSQDLPVVEAYRIFIETNGRDGEARLDRLGYSVSSADRVSNQRKEQTLRACDDLLASLKQVYGGGGLENIRESMDALTDLLRPEQRNEISNNPLMIDRILKQGVNGLEDLGIVVKMRQAINDVVGHAGGETLYQALKLDLRLEVLVYRILNSLDETVKNSPEGLLLMLDNSRLNGYGGAGIGRLVKELESVTQKTNGRQKDMRLYAVIRKTERMMKDALGDAVSGYQTMAEQTGAALSVGNEDQIWVENFSSNIFRGDSLYLLSLLTNRLKETVKNKLGFSGWQVVVDGTMSGKLHYVDGLERLNEVKEDEILVIDRLPSDSPVLSRVAGIIVFEEDSLLSHPAIRARQNGIPYIVCPDKVLIEKYYGQEMTIAAKGSDVDIREGKIQSNSFVKVGQQIQVPSADLKSDIVILPEDYSPDTVGQKAYNLHEMDSIPLAYGQRQARHMALSFALYDRVLQDPSNQQQRTSMNAALDLLTPGGVFNENAAGNLAKIRNGVESMRIPLNMLEQVRNSIRQQIPTGLVFLRSSTNAEDLPSYAGAGLYDSFGAVDPDDFEQLEMYIKKVWASVWNERAYADRERNGIDHKSVHMAVLVHEMVNAAYSYVVHTVNPLSKNPDEMMIELVQGLGEALVSSSMEYQGAPHRFVYNKKTEKITRMGYADKDWRLVVKDGRLARELTDFSDDIFVNGNGEDLLPGLFKQAVGVEQFFNGKAQDIEGCFLKKDVGNFETVFVQSRDQQAIEDKAMLVNFASSTYQHSVVDMASSVKPDKTGGIDLTPNRMSLQVNNSGDNAQFKFDPVMLKRLQDASGLTPVIIEMRPMTMPLPEFFGIKQSNPNN